MGAKYEFLTRESPNPFRPQFTCDKYAFSASATGDTKLELGNISVSQIGHW